MKYLVYADSRAERRSREIAAREGCGDVTLRWFPYQNSSTKSALLVSDSDAAKLYSDEQSNLQATLDWNTVYTPPSYAGPTALGDVPAAPVDLASAIAGLESGGTLELQSGVYTVSGTGIALGPAGIDADNRTTIKAAAGARVIVTCEDGTAPALTHSANMDIDGIWFLGSRVEGDGVRRGIQLANNVHLQNNLYAGYTDSMAVGSSKNLELRGNVVLFSGEGGLYHGVYFSDSEATQSDRPIVEDCVYLWQSGGYAINCFHNATYVQARYNFIDCASPRGQLVAQSPGGTFTHNLLWGGGINASDNHLRNTSTSVARTFSHNLFGPAVVHIGVTLASNTYGDILSSNYFYLSPSFGDDPVILDGADIETRIGATAAAIEDARNALGASFSADVASIYADDTIVGNIAILKACITAWKSYTSGT